MASLLNLIISQEGTSFAACMSPHNPRKTGPTRYRIPWYMGSERIVEMQQTPTSSIRDIYLRDEQTNFQDVFGELSSLVPPKGKELEEFIKENIKTPMHFDDALRFPGYLHTAQEVMPVSTVDSILRSLTKDLLPSPGRGKVLILTEELTQWYEYSQRMWYRYIKK